MAPPNPTPTSTSTARAQAKAVYEKGITALHYVYGGILTRRALAAL